MQHHTLESPLALPILLAKVKSQIRIKIYPWPQKLNLASQRIKKILPICNAILNVVTETRTLFKVLSEEITSLAKTKKREVWRSKFEQ